MPHAYQSSLRGSLNGLLILRCIQSPIIQRKFFLYSLANDARCDTSIITKYGSVWFSTEWVFKSFRFLCPYLRFPVFCAPHTIFFAASSSLGIGGIDIETAKLPTSGFLTRSLDAELSMLAVISPVFWFCDISIVLYFWFEV